MTHAQEIFRVEGILTLFPKLGQDVAQLHLRDAIQVLRRLCFALVRTFVDIAQRLVVLIIVQRRRVGKLDFLHDLGQHSAAHIDVELGLSSVCNAR